MRIRKTNGLLAPVPRAHALPLVIDRCPQEAHDRRIREQSLYVTPQTGGRPMPIANIRGVHITYQVLGEHGPWVALSPGGRRDLSGVMPLATQVAAAGYRVLLHD